MTWIRNRPLGLVYRDPDQSFEGYTLFSSVRGHHATLLDHEGRIVHQWHHPEGIQHLYLIDDGHLLIQTLPPEDAGGAEQIGGSAGVLAELDWDSRVVWEYRDALMHHDYRRLDDGNHLVIAWDKLPEQLNDRVQGGHVFEHDPKPMWADVVKEINPAGKVVREWRSWEHLSFEQDRICPLESHKEWTHANSIDLTPDGDWLISFRLTSTLAIVDGQSGAVKWRWGPGHLSHQHCASWLENGHILVFDNGCHRPRSPSFSRVVELDPEKQEIVWSYFHPTILAFYSFMVSGCERLANGNTFITEGATGRLFEVTPEGETVWEYVSPWILPSNFGPTPAVFRAHRIPAGDSRLAGRELSPGPYEALTRRIDAHEVLGEGDQGRESE
jgi:hypothetical protein